MVFLIAVLFFFSGLTSLVYETLWIRILSLGVGSTSASMGLVLSIFFFGLSMGSFIAGKFSHKVKRPLLTYGVLEGLIGLYSLVVIYILFDFHKILGFLPLEGSFSWFGVTMKFVLVFLFLLVPTVAMGASLPLLVKIFVKGSENLGKKLGLLYGLNTMGAVFGAFLAGFYFIPTFGIMKSNVVMALLNFAILIIAYLLQKKLAPIETPVREKKPFFTLLPKNSSAAKKLILISCGMVGFTSITAEVVWNKYLGIFLGSNIFGLGLILSLFLLGIALGSLILSLYVEKVKDKVNLFITLAILGVGLTLAATYLLNGAPLLVHLISYYLGETVSVLTIKSVITGIILFIPTSFFGALLPLGTRILVDDHHDTPEIVGTAYTINTIGSILGSSLSGLILIPVFGSAFTLKFGLVLLVVIILFLTARKFRNPLPLSISLLALFVIFFAQGIDFKNIIKSAYYQRSTSESSLAEVMKYFSSEDGEDFKMIIEGKTGIISLSQVPYEGEDWQDYLRLKTNGLNESFYNLEKIEELPKYEGLLAFLPYALVAVIVQIF
jgi:spermidine synthase